MTIAMLFLARPIASVYNFSGETGELLVKALMTMAILLTPKMLGYMYIVGILRAGGDTVFCMYLELGTNLFIQVPVAYFAVLVLHTSLPLAMILVELGAIVRIGLSVPRFRSRKWINIVTD